MARKNFTQLQQEVINYVQGDSGDAEALGIAGSGINAGIDQFNSFAWPAQSTTSGFTFVAEQRDYNAPTDAIAFTELRVLDSNGDQTGRLRYRLPQVFERLYNPNYSTIPTGSPVEYTIYGEGSTQPTIRLSSKPSSNYVASTPTGEVRYSQEIPQLSGTAETMTTNRQVEQAILWFAKSYISSIYDPEKIQYAEARFQDLFDKEMIQANRSRQLRNY